MLVSCHVSMGRKVFCYREDNAIYWIRSTTVNGTGELLSVSQLLRPSKTFHFTNWVHCCWRVSGEQEGREYMVSLKVPTRSHSSNVILNSMKSWLTIWIYICLFWIVNIEEILLDIYKYCRLPVSCRNTCGIHPIHPLRRSHSILETILLAGHCVRNTYLFNTVLHYYTVVI